MIKNGIIKESNREYHLDSEYISKSVLAKMAICPQYFKWYLENEQEKSADLILGSAFHKIVLEPKDFDNEFAVMPPIDRRTSAGREQYNNFIAESEGKEIITQDDYNTICEMRDSILNNRYARALINGYTEQSMYTTDELTGEGVKARPDVWRNVKDRVVITDLKSCKSALMNDVTRDVVKYSYDLQAYMYSLIASQVLNVPMENIDFIFIFCEKKAPYLINITQADENVLKRGETLFRQYIGMYHECKETDNWYGLNGEMGVINNLSLPDYLLKDVNDKDE